MNMDKCVGNCIICGKCNSTPILEHFSQNNIIIEDGEGYGIAIDIGTTTVVLALVDLVKGTLLARHSFLNPQRAFGPDVISRIDAANKNNFKELNQMITNGIVDAVGELLANKNASPKSVVRMVITGNTTMTYLLLGFSCESLGVYPFKATHEVLSHYKAASIFGTFEISCDILMFPHFAAFIGGDIVAGLLHTKSLGIPSGVSRFMLIDLGTNGEMALYNNGELIVTATAAGPAFETAAGRGASNVISLLADMLKLGAIDETGLLDESALNPLLTQTQIRELQLAKSAVRTGLEILLKNSGLSYDDLDALYLAGGIGQAINTIDACVIGLIPDELQNKATPIGNAALGGAVSLLLAPSSQSKTIDNIIASAKEINLATHPNFNDYFVENMLFDEEDIWT
jgi:uncharacterized 2Fe-2S/4Fe-4S cluster protein (DUF4445 family)